MSKTLQHFKFVAVGDGTVGKTCMLMSFAKNEFPEKYVPTVFDNTIALLAVDGTTFELELWDTAGTDLLQNSCSGFSFSQVKKITIDFARLVTLTQILY